MAKEQEEAIDYVQKQIDYFKEQIKFIEAVDSDYYDEEYGLYKNRVKQFETVLNMLKEKDKQINSKNGAINALQCALKERTEERDRKDDIITKLNKQIDSMADYMLSGLDDTTFNNICKQGHCVHVLKDNRPTKCRKCKDCIKQYFERKSKEWKKI